MNQPSLSIVPAASLTPEVRAEILAVCSDAYEEDFGWYLELLEDAVHVLARVDGQLVCHAAWVERKLYAGGMASPLRAAYVEAVATPARFQRRGYGSAVLSAIPPLVGDFDLAALSPSRQDFYLRLGWEPWRGPLAYRKGQELVSTPDEEVMIYRLPKTPPSLDLDASLTIDWRPGEVW
jgi:aminoglycoside 2'-N-acetyltransferase I